jgi:hypothetical protein
MALVHPNELNKTKIQQVLAEKVDTTGRKNPVFAMLQEKSRFVFRDKRLKYEWSARLREYEAAATDPYWQNTNFPAPDLREMASLEYVSYDMGSSYTRAEAEVMDENKNVVADYVKRMTDEMSKDFMKKLRREIYGDGNAGAANVLQGFESWNNVTGLVSGGLVGDPDDLYAGLYTNLQNYGGTWTGTWPAGTSETPEYCGWSPIVVDYNNVNFTGTTYTWRNQWQEACGFAWRYLSTLTDTRPDFIVVTTEMLRQAADSMIGKQTVEVTQPTDLMKLGFRSIQHGGLELIDEFNVPADSGYVVNVDELEFRSVLPQLLGYAKDFEIRTFEHLRKLWFLGQMICYNPRTQAKLAAISTAGT